MPHDTKDLLPALGMIRDSSTAITAIAVPLINRIGTSYPGDTIAIRDAGRRIDTLEDRLRYAIRLMGAQLYRQPPMSQAEFAELVPLIAMGFIDRIPPNTHQRLAKALDAGKLREAFTDLTGIIRKRDITLHPGEDLLLERVQGWLDDTKP